MKKFYFSRSEQRAFFEYEEEGILTEEQFDGKEYVHEKKAKNKSRATLVEITEEEYAQVTEERLTGKDLGALQKLLAKLNK